MRQPAAGHTVPLPSRLAVGELAWSSVLAAGAALSPDAPTAPDPAQVAAAYRSDRHLLIDGEAPDVWSPLSRFWRVSDGWVRTHGNYPHHAAALRSGIGAPEDAAAVDIGERLSRMTAEAATRMITSAGGLCVPVRREHPHDDAALRRHPIVETHRLTHSPARRRSAATTHAPLAGLRVLDLTRVIAGPVATRTLAFAGADVLRIDPLRLPEPAWQHLDVGHGKRSALRDVDADRPLFESLLADADAVVLGYRPSGLARLGLSPEALAERHPHLVIGQLSAWPGDGSPRGFDSLVQADSGISWIESPDGATPGALPAQALDHSAGYLLAAGIATALRRRGETGGGWLVRTSLRRVAAELLGMPRDAAPAYAADPGSSTHATYTARTQEFDVGGRRVTTVAPAVRWPGSPEAFSPPRPWGGDAAEWW
ncbi:CoA transferase [Microbacterium esteraromaticum]|uniref:CoA transferase n=1 Tax=Microbacterium esteraromaticum TaxID=57043 RepID=UPI001957DD4A|nr:CoA transferase [Microbacterium esteraromaticum]MBM7464935.1 crotonobetainyl-CoA:carnitine CoA-transferase CaiB-like acyl-CoA transferase [Microbacterium esteraromaticum]